MATSDNFLLSSQIGLLDQILAASTDHIYVCDRNGRFLYASPAGLAAFGLEAEDMLGHTWDELHLPIDGIERQNAQQELVFQTGLPVRGEANWLTQQGRREYEYILSPLIGMEGSIEAVVSTWHDITTQKPIAEALQPQAQAQLEDTESLGPDRLVPQSALQSVEQAWFDSELRFSILIDAVFEAMIVHEQGQILLANPGFARLSGYTLAEVMGQSIAMFLTPDSLELVLRNIASQYEQSYEVTGIKKDGTRLDLEVVGQPCLYQGRKARVSAIRNITDRKQVELALQKSEANLRKAQEIAHLGNWEHNWLTQQMHWSEETYRIHGMSPEQPIAWGEDAMRYIHPDDYAKYRQEILAAVERGELFTTDLRIVRADGVLRFIEARGEPLFDAHNNPIGLWGTVQDITDRKQAELALQESEARFAATFHASPDAILITRLRDGLILDVNPQFTEISGYSRAEVMGRSSVELNLWADPGERAAVVARLQTEATIHNHEFCFQRQSGEILFGLFSGQVIELDGEACALSVVRDITQRKQVELALQIANDRYNRVLDSIGEGIWDWDCTIDSAVVSSRYWEILGYDPQSSKGDRWVDSLNRVHPDDRDRLQQALDQHLRHHQPYAVEVRLQHQAGHYIWIRSRGQAIWDAQDRPLRMIGAIEDISDRKRLELGLQESERKLKEVLDSTIAGIVKLRFYPDGSYEYDYISPHCERIYTYTPEELMADGHLWQSRIHPEDQRDVLFPLMQTILHQTGTATYSMEYRFRRNNESIGWILANLWVAWDEAGGYWNITIVDTDISDRKQAELALKESETRFLELSNASPANIYILVSRSDRSFYFEHISRAIETIHEIPAERFLENPYLILEGMHPEDQASYQAKVEHSLATLAPFAHEWRIITTSGTIKWVQGASCPKLRDNGDIAWYGAVIDITDRKQAEAKLQEREMILRLFAQYAPAGIVMFDREMRYVMASQRWVDNHGLGSIDSIIGRSHYEVLPHLPQHLRQIHQRCLAGAIETSDGELFVLADGLPHWLAWEMRPWHTHAGEIGGVILSSLDVTQRKQAELALQELNQSLEQKVLERTAELHASEHQIRQQANREALLREITQRIRQSLDLQTIFHIACEEILQWSQADRVGIFQFDPESQFEHGMFVAEAVIPEFPSVLATPVQDHCFGNDYAPLYHQGRVQATPDIDNAGLQDCHRDVLAQFQIRANLIVPLLQGHDLWGLLCIHQCSAPRQWQPFEIDVTQEIANQLTIAIQQAKLFKQLQQELKERQQAQEQLADRNQQLARSNQELAHATRMKDEFLANMSHELRTPLNAILGMSEGLQEQVFGEINEQQLKALQTIEHTGLHLLELINDILDLAKVESGQIKLTVGSTNVTALCQSSLEFVKQQALKKQIQCDLNLPPDLPDICVDERRIRQVLINLLNNAVKFTPNGGKITLEVRWPVLPPAGEETKSWLQLAVLDTGIGIAPEDFPRLFQPFVQLDSALNRQYEGTGLGLSLVQRIVKLHGGQVGVTSELGVGSCFTIDLPCEMPQPLAPDGLSQLPALEPSQPDQLSSPLILVVEDNEDNILTLINYLDVKGYRLLVARNGQEAIALTQTEQPDLILMDIQMPGMDGLEAIQYIRQLPTQGNVPIIALTALVMEGDRDRCLAAGANDYLSKPIQLKQLVATIQQFLNHKS